MTNLAIIVTEAITNKIYTESQVEEILCSGSDLGIHTFQGWKKRGFVVKKGEHATITTKLWKYKTKVEKLEDSKGNEVEELTSNYYLCKSFLFTREQVQAIA